MQGQVLEVSITPAGDELSTAHAAGATTLTLMSIQEFSDETGGFLQVENVVYEYDTVDKVAGTVHLLAGLQTDAEEGEKVFTLPLAEEKWAMVEVKDFDEPISARVEHGLKDKMEDGVREPEDQETVILEMRDGDWTVVDLIEEVPSIDGTYLASGTVPMPDSSDGLAPASSPTPEVIDGLGAFYLRWVPPANADPMKFEVHVSATPGFTPDATTKYTETSAYSATVRNLPVIDVGTGQFIRFSYEVPYFFKIVAKDEDDAAAPSVETSSTLHQITGPDIAVNTIKGENIFGETLTGDLFSGTVVLGSTISTGAIDEDGNITGARVDLGPLGLMNYDSAGSPVVKLPTDDTDDAFVRAHMEMLSADVFDNFSMFGKNNQIGRDGRLMLAAGVVPPTSPPTISYAYDTVKFNTTTAVPPHSGSTGFNLGTFSLNPAQVTSIAWNQTWSAWEVIQQKSAGFRVWRFTNTGAVYNNLATGRPWVEDYNDRTNASGAFGIGTGNNAGGMALFQQGTDWFVWGPQINRIPASWILDAADRPPCLGFDQVNNQWMLVQNNGGGNGTIHIRRFSLNSGTNADGSFKSATSISTISTEVGSGMTQRINGATFAPITPGGANRYVINADSYATCYVFDSAGTLMDNEGSYECWTKPGSALGLTFNGTQYGSVDSAGVLTFYETWNWPTVSATAWVGASAFDSDTAGDPANPHVGQTAGQHETPVGSLTSFTQRRRAKLVVTMSETPDNGGADDVDQWRLYFARKATTPTKTDLKYIDAIGSPTARTSKVVTAEPTGGNPAGGIQGQTGAVNNFPSASPARFVSTGVDALSAPVIDFTGDGAGRAGPYKWDKTGAPLDGDPSFDTGWVGGWAVKGGSTPFPNTAATIIGRAEYRRIGKQVQVVLAMTAGAAFNPTAANFANQNIVTGLPAEACPAANVVMSAHYDNQPVSVVLLTSGVITLAGGPRPSPAWPTAAALEATITYFLG